MVLVPLLTAALVLTVFLPRATSLADSGNPGITWTPGQMSIDQDPSGQCFAAVTGSFTAVNQKEAIVISNLFDALKEKPFDVPQEGFGKETIRKSSLDAAKDRVTVESRLGVDCGIAVQPGPNTRGRGLLPIPRWLNGGVSSGAANVLYVVVGVAVTAAIVLAVGEATLSATAQTALIALAGCLGGSAMTAATHALSGAAPGWKGGLVDGAAGCISGTTFALLPVRTIGTRVAQVMGGWAGRPVRDVLGAGLVSAAQSAGTDTSVVTVVLNGIATGATQVAA